MKHPKYFEYEVNRFYDVIASKNFNKIMRESFLLALSLEDKEKEVFEDVSHISNYILNHYGNSSSHFKQFLKSFQSKLDDSNPLKSYRLEPRQLVKEDDLEDITHVFGLDFDHIRGWLDRIEKKWHDKNYRMLHIETDQNRRKFLAGYREQNDDEFIKSRVKKAAQ